MKILLDHPAGWAVTDGGRLASSPGGEATLHIEPSVPLPLDPAVVGRRWLAAELTAGATIRLIGAVEHQSRDGWPVALFDARVYDAAGVEGAARLVALYRLIDHLAVVRVEANAGWLAAHRAELEARVLAATVDWGSEPVAMAQLWRA